MRRWIAFLELLALLALGVAPLRAPEWGRAASEGGVACELSPKVERDAIKPEGEARSAAPAPRADVPPPQLGSPPPPAPWPSFEVRASCLELQVRPRDSRGDIRRGCWRRVPPEEPPERTCREVG